MACVRGPFDNRYNDNHSSNFPDVNLRFYFDYQTTKFELQYKIFHMISFTAVYLPADQMLVKLLHFR